jgi:hypothetical protein
MHGLSPEPMISNDLAPVWRGIVARASFVHERRAPEFTHDLTNDKQIQTHLDEWLEAVSEERDRALLERLWEWDGIDEPTARAMVAPVSFNDNAPLPEWAALLQKVLSATDLPPLIEGTLIASEPLPFQKVFAPFFACRRGTGANKPRAS